MWSVYETANTEEQQPIAWQCSECGEVVGSLHPFCPNCGVKHENGGSTFIHEDYGC